MGLLYTMLALSFVILFLVNIGFVIINIIFLITHGIQAFLQNMSFTERVYASLYFKWILLADITWLIVLMIFLSKRRSYKTNTDLHYLLYRPITNPKICVSMPTYNEEPVIEKVVKDFINQKYVNQVIVIDNHSSDNTVEIAKRCGASVITKNENKGYAHSIVMGLQEALNTDANIIAIVDADGTYNGFDISKMLPYLDNCDMVVGTRMVQVLTEKGNQNDLLLTWGNNFIAKLLQAKYFSLQHMGVIQLTDVGCTFRLIRRDALERIIGKFIDPKTHELVKWANGNAVALFTLAVSIENDLKIVEIPITFNKRIGVSKTGIDKKTKAIKYGLEFIWFIIRS